MAHGLSLQILSPGQIGSVTTRNRVIRSATSETMADERGFITERYRDFHLRLARNHVGLIFTGHCSVHPSGRYRRGMVELSSDAHIPLLRDFTASIHAEGARIFAELNHAGSQSRVPDMTPLAPSVVPNPQFHRTPREATDEEIREIVRAFGRAAARVRDAGFDGVHVHAGHGYLISEFLSPLSNLRTDRWGGSVENRQRIGLEMFRAMRQAVGPDFSIAWNSDCATSSPGASRWMRGCPPPRRWIGSVLTRWRARRDSCPQRRRAPSVRGGHPSAGIRGQARHRVLAKPRPDAYFCDWARMPRERVRCTVIMVGGLRTVETMERG